jgi:hypothetical protein
MENGVGKGSGRSVRGVDLGAAVLAARQAGHLINGGGHRMAAGFTVAREAEPAFRQFLAERIAVDVGRGGRRLRLDGALQAGGATTGLLASLGRWRIRRRQPGCAALTAPRLKAAWSAKSLLPRRQGGAVSRPLPSGRLEALEGDARCCNGGLPLRSKPPLNAPAGREDSSSTRGRHAGGSRTLPHKKVQQIKDPPAGGEARATPPLSSSPMINDRPSSRPPRCARERRAVALLLRINKDCWRDRS